MLGRDSITVYLHSLITYYEGKGNTCVESVLLERGTWFEGRRHSDEYPKAKAWKSKARPQNCYANSQHYCVSDKQARYFEGYAQIPGLHSIEHAWIVMSDGGVIDFTMELMEIEASRNGVPCDTSGTVYLGLEIPVELLLVTTLKTGETQPLLDLFCAHLTSWVDS